MNKLEIRNMVLGLPKSLLINYEAFGLWGIIHMPILVSNRIHFKGIKSGTISISPKTRFGSIKIGINLGPFNRGLKKETFIYINKGKLIFDGKANIASDSVINVNGGTILFGDNFSANNGFMCSCEKKIEFGRNVLLGWNCTIMDGDGHRIVEQETKQQINLPRPITIGSHIWIASSVTVTKGAQIPDDSVIGEGTLVNQKLENSNSLYVGRPVKRVRDRIDWIR